MRSKFVFGSVIMYIALAFVPPSQQNVLARMQTARADIASTALGALFDDSIGSSDEVKAAQSVVKGLAAKAVRTAPRATKPLTVARSASWKKMMVNESVPALKAFLYQVDFAQRKSDVRHCRDFDPSYSHVRGVIPTAGDLLALCLAKVTGDPRRCEQISVATAPDLRSVCSRELVGHRSHALITF